MDIEKRLSEVGNYFKAKILNGDYEFLSCSNATAKIEIDKKYIFTLWIENDPKEDFRVYDFHENFGMKDVIIFKSDKERLQGYSKIKTYIEKSLKESLEKSLKEIQDKLSTL